MTAGSHYEVRLRNPVAYLRVMITSKNLDVAGTSRDSENRYNKAIQGELASAPHLSCASAAQPHPNLQQRDYLIDDVLIPASCLVNGTSGRGAAWPFIRPSKTFCVRAECKRRRNKSWMRIPTCTSRAKSASCCTATKAFLASFCSRFDSTPASD
jgi:hypothetical protein